MRLHYQTGGAVNPYVGVEYKRSFERESGVAEWGMNRECPGNCRLAWLLAADHCDESSVRLSQSIPVQSPTISHAERPVKPKWLINFEMSKLC